MKALHVLISHRANANRLFAKEQEVICLKVHSLHVRVDILTFCPKGASFSASAASVAFWTLLKVRLNKLLTKRQEVICLKEASFSASAASVALWALLKVRSN